MRYFSCLFALVFLGVCNSAVATGSMERIQKESMKVLNVNDLKESDFRPTEFNDEVLEFAKGVTEYSKGVILSSQSDDTKPEDNPKLIIFLSSSMGENRIKQVLRENSSVDTLFILRGLLPGTRYLLDTHRYMSGLIGDIDPRPNVVLNPEFFSKWSITSVPAFVYAKEEQLLLKVEGEISGKWVIKQAVENDKSGDLGKVGQTFPIAERDLIDDLKERYANINWEEKKKQAVSRYLSRQQFITLADAKENKSFKIDPSIRFTKSIPGASGKLIASKGQVVNPLKVLPFNATVIVFDGVNPNHLAFTKRTKKEMEEQGKRVILITSRFDVSKGENVLSDIESELSGAVYLLNKSIVNRFDLRALPSIVFSQGNSLTIKEVNVGASHAL